jgi:hypothetical protein
MACAALVGEDVNMTRLHLLCNQYSTNSEHTPQMVGCLLPAQWVPPVACAAHTVVVVFSLNLTCRLPSGVHTRH